MYPPSLNCLCATSLLLPPLQIKLLHFSVLKRHVRSNFSTEEIHSKNKILNLFAYFVRSALLICFSNVCYSYRTGNTLCAHVKWDSATLIFAEGEMLFCEPKQNAFLARLFVRLRTVSPRCSPDPCSSHPKFPIGGIFLLPEFCHLAEWQSVCWSLA